MTDKKKRDTRYKPGQSGNKAGRPTGIPGRRAALRVTLAEHPPAVVEALVGQAKAGDVGACIAILRHCLPVIRPSREPVVIKIEPGSTPTEAAGALVNAACVASLPAIKRPSSCRLWPLSADSARSMSFLRGYKGWRMYVMNLDSRLKKLEIALPQPVATARFDDHGYRMVGGPGCYLLVPPSVDPKAWAKAATKQQAELAAGDAKLTESAS